ncbi:dispersed gene family protein 1 (DGF-1) [Trypanosoma cruzi]|uniref:Dispersed gene family protein 1 (DGF-1) n=1 Tax=Trypanosoma cruzi TaxID=5693 RepID=A0A2V2V521_TRYCR|nr:dispersed gene family protein 1 (DGF-1) [Trypanosoma cruzi]
MWSSVGACPRGRHRVRCRAIAAVRVALLVALVLVAAAAWMTAVHAVVLRLRGGTVDRAITVGRAVDTVLMDGVYITNGVAVVFDVAAMLPGPLRIELRNCLCDGGVQIYVRGYSGEAASDRSLEVSAIGLSGSYCSLVFVHNLPAHTNVTVRDSTIITAGPMRYSQLSGLTDAVASPLVLYATSLLQSQLRVSSTVLRSSQAGGSAVHVGGGMDLLSSAVVFDGVLLEASGGPTASALHVANSSRLSLRNHSVLSVTNVSVVSGGGGIVLGERLAVFDSVLRFVGVEGSVASSLVRCGGGTIGGGGWLDIHDVWAVGEASSVASLSGVTLSGGTVSIARCAATGATLVSGLAITSGVVSVQCNSAGGRVLQSSGDYRMAGLPSVSVVPCDGCAAALACFDALTASFTDCVCSCRAGGVGDACVPFDVPPARSGGGGGAQDCVSGVTLTESVTVGGWRATACFDSVVFSGPITVTVDLRLLDVFADALNVTLRHCVLAGGAQLRIGGLSESTARLMPHVLVNMTNVTSLEGTIVLHGAMPLHSSVLLANSTLRATVGGSQYVPTTRGHAEFRYGPALVLDGVRLLSTRFVMTRSMLACGGGSCAAILVERGLGANLSSVFYMDNCVVMSRMQVMYALASDLRVSGGSVFSIQNSSWSVSSINIYKGACDFGDVVVDGGSVMQVVSSEFRLGFAMLMAKTLTVTGGSWLVHRNNEFRTAYVVYVADENGVAFCDRSVWSIIDNNFTHGSYSLTHAYMTNDWPPPYDELPTIYGVCNEARGSPVTDYQDDLNIGVPVTALDCGACTVDAVCFAARTSSISGCECVCAAGGHGDTCLPAAVPDGLGPLPLSDAKDTEVRCVHGGSIRSVDDPDPGVRGLCFVNVTFTAAIVLDLWSFDAPQQTLNITLLQCVLMGLLIRGSGARVHVSVTSSMLDAGDLEFKGDFGTSSQVLVAGCTFVMTSSHAIQFQRFTLGVNSSLLLLDNVIEGESYAVRLSFVVVDGGGIIMKGNTLRGAEEYVPLESAVLFESAVLKNGGYFDVENNKMSAGSGIYFYGDTTVSSAGLLRVADCTFVGITLFFEPALVRLSASVTLEGGAQWRVTGNNVSAASIIGMPNSLYKVKLLGSGTTVVLSNNRQVDSSKAFAQIAPWSTIVTSPARFVVGCNLQGGEEVSYDGVFPEGVLLFRCGTCNDDAACYMPGTESVDRGSCSCSCKDGWHGASCLPLEVPDAVVLPVPERAVDGDTSCVVDQTLTNLTLNMWKTHHCYVGVTFSGVGAVLTFSLSSMPLYLPINITLTGCTFREGASLRFVGGAEVVESAGVLIRVSRTVMRSSVVAFALALPQHCDIAVTEVDAVQFSEVQLLESVSNMWSVMILQNVVLSASSLLVSNVRARAFGYGSLGLYSTGTLSLVAGSSLYARYCGLDGYEHLFYVYRLSVSDHSVFALLKNAMASGTSLLYQHQGFSVSYRSVLRVVGNSGSVFCAIYSRNLWTVQQSSWLDWRDNDVELGAMFCYSLITTVNIDGSSVVTLTGCRMGSTGLSVSLLSQADTGYRFVAGCLTIAGRVVTTAAELELNGITNVTTVAACGECTKEGDCFAPLTTAVIGCKCQCAAGGHGDVCVPAPVPAGSPPPPPPPVPPSPPSPPVGECISDMVYPEVAQAVGSGLSWLCYRNVTFSGGGMSLTVLIGAMTGDVASVTFDGCTWRDGAVLLLLGNAYAAVGSLNIVVTGNTFRDALLSPEGVFPPRTNITINGNRFTVTRLIPRSGLEVMRTSCVSMNELVISKDSAVVLSGNVFHSVRASSSAIHVVGSSLSVSWHSLFAVVGNTFHMAGANGTLIYLGGSRHSLSLSVLNNSAVVIRGNIVSMPVKYFLLVILALRVESWSAVLFQGNDMQGSSVVFYSGYSPNIYYNSWLQVSGNLCRESPSEAFAVFNPRVNLRDSTVSVSGNRFMSSAGTPTALWIPKRPRDITNGAIVAACNTVKGEEEAEYSIPSVYNVTILTCSDPCTLATSCFPAYTTTASSDGCACRCAEGGHGDACLPVAVPEPPSTDGADLCVRDVRVDVKVNAGLGTSVACYVGVTFAADVVVDVESMSGSVRNVTLANCTFLGRASLYVVGWRSDPPAGERVDVLVSGLESRSGGGVVVASRFSPGSRVTVVDSVLVAEKRVAYRGAYDLGDASACLVVHNVNLTGSVLTIARTQVAAVFGDAVGVLFVGGVALSSRGALYVDGLSVQTALGLCVSVEGGVATSGGSVVAFVDSDFLLCKHAVSVRGAVSVSDSAVALVRSEFSSTEDYAAAFYSTVSLDGGSMLLAKGNVHDGVSREMLYAAGAVTAAGSTLSFVRNRALLPRMLSLSLSLAAGAHVRVACNDAGGRALSTAEEYAAAGFGDAGRIDVAGCGDCDRDTHCYAPGTASASMRNGVCVCLCGSGGYGEACVPVGAPALPPAVSTAPSVLVREGVTVQSVFVVPAGVSEVTLRHVVLDGVSPVLYVPWMARDGVRIVVQNVSLLNGAVLYVMGEGLRGAGAAGSDESGPVELSVCDVEALNGALVLSGTFPAGSVLTVTDSLLVAARPTPLVYLPGSQSSPYAPVLVLSGLRLVRSVLVVSGVALVTVMTGGRTVVVDGTVLELVGGGVALDAAVFGGDVAFYASARVVASGGAVLRVSGSQVYAAHGLVFGSGAEANASAVVVNDNVGVLTDGALLELRGSASFASGSWLSVRGNSISGRLLSLPSYPCRADLVQSTLTLHGNAGSGPVVMDGTVALVGAGGKFVVGCLTLNGQALQPMHYRSAGIIGEFRPVACGVCDADVRCFAAATRAMSGSCGCRCAEGGYGRDCLPVYLPHVDGCNRTPGMPLLSHTATLTETHSLTSTWTPSLSTTHYSPTRYGPTKTLQMTETVALPPTRTPTASVSSTLWWSDVACPTLAVTTTAAGGSLTQNDIRGGGSAVPTLLMVELPPPFRWARDPQLGTHLSFVPVSTVQPSGFGGPWGAMLSNATWVRNATNPSTVLELAVPLHRGYFIGADETIVIRCDAAAVFGGCKGVLLGSFTIRSNTLPAAASALSAITGVVAGAAAVAVVVTGGLGSILEMQALGVFARMPCASAQERASTVALPYFLSVFAARDPLWMVVGNALLAAVFGCVHCGVTAAFQRWRGVDAASAWAAMRFPSLTYVVAHAMHLGIFFGSVLALAMPDARVQHRVIGAVGVLYGAAFPAGVCYFIARHVGASFTRYWQFSRKPLHERLLYPVGYWHPAAQQRMYGGMLTNMRGSHVYWCVFQLSVLCVVCLIAAVHPPVGGCHVQYFCMAAVLLAGAGVVAFTNMMRSAFLTVMRAASFVLLAALCLVSAANHLAPSDGGARAYAAIVLLLIAVLLAATVYSVVVWHAEDRHWQELREPRRGGLEALLRDDEESGDETQKPHDVTSSSYASGTTAALSYRPPAPPLRSVTGDTRSDALSLFDGASSASCSINYAPLDR